MTRFRNNVDAGLLLVRLALGIVFVMHGWQKLTAFGLGGVTGMLGGLGVPLPTVGAVALIATEFVGGLALLLGAFSRIAGLLTAFAMLAASALVHWPAGFFLPNGYEFTLTLALASLGIVAAGAGRYSLDAILWRDQSGPVAAPGQPSHAKAA